MADALYATRVFIRAVQQHGWDAVIRLKDNRLTILQDAKGLLKITLPVITRQLGHELLQSGDFLALSWGPLAHLRIIYGERTVTTRKRGHRHHRQMVTTRQGLGPDDLWGRRLGPDGLSHHASLLGSGKLYLPARQDDRDLAHCFGHDPAIIEALVGAQLIAVMWWIGWTTRKTVSTACKKMPRIEWIEMAREALGDARREVFFATMSPGARRPPEADKWPHDPRMRSF